MVDDELAALRAKMRQNAGPSEGLPPRIDKEKIHLLAPAHAVNAAEVADLLDRDAASVQQRDETECVASLPLHLFPRSFCSPLRLFFGLQTSADVLVHEPRHRPLARKAATYRCASPQG